ncbi:discoidin domain-containing protein [Verrucomicrobiaceae bacterium 227]
MNIKFAAGAAMIAVTAFSSSLNAAIISTDGSLYTGITVNSEYSAAYTADNLFDQTLSIGDNPGTGDDSNRAWSVVADQGNAIIEFELDAVYTIDALIYSQRQFNSNDTRDKSESVSIWASSTTPFTTGTPTVAADIVNLSLNTNVTDTFTSYSLPSNLTGRYFRLEFEALASSEDSYIGGTELRFNAVPEPGSALLLSVAGVLGLLRRRR